MDYEKINSDILETLSGYDMKLVYLFGSCYRKELKEGSDVNLAMYIVSQKKLRFSPKA